MKKASPVSSNATSTGLSIPPLITESKAGREAILAGIRGWGATRLEYTIDRSYSASGHVVFDGAIAAIYETQTGSVAYRYPIITIVTVEDGHVTEHRDYTDFSGMTQEAR